ncbi:CDP-archaeol synthase [Candidatus Parcubacteria bacterium]|jgi:CDP-2,3-bis-(O-geranylgeranyl)-sn-glycerol synthase|nr:CDP-archaeol synthase [Candidatus Parcubacteria bacterium]
MFIYLVKIFWFFLPAGVANMAPVLFKWVPWLNYPIDFNKRYKDQPIFGPHKTIRGFFFGILACMVFLYWQTTITGSMTDWLIIDYSQTNVFLLGFLMGFGALFGDAIRSFFKRRRQIKPGVYWFPFDQIDWIIGTIIFMSFYVYLPWHMLLSAVAMALFFHPFFNYLGYIFKIKKNKF